MLAFGTQIRGYAPGRSRRIFRGQKILSTPSFGGEAKPSAPCRSFTTCKRSLNVTWKSAFRQNLPDISRPQFHLPPLGAWRRLVAKVGTSNPDRTVSLKRLQCVVENNNIYTHETTVLKAFYAVQSSTTLTMHMEAARSAETLVPISHATKLNSVALVRE